MGARKSDIVSQLDAALRLPALAALVDAAAEQLCLLDADYRVVAANEAFCSAWDQPREHVLGSHLSKIMGSAAFIGVFAPKLAECLGTGSVTFSVNGPVGRTADCLLETSLRRVSLPGIGRDNVLMTARDISDSADLLEQRELNQLLDYHVRHCSLTGLYNRAEFESAVSAAVKQACDGRRSYALAICDLDFFKVINDACGHDAGDRVLIDVARMLEENTRRSDIVARLGGDEFGLLLVDCTADQAARILESVRAAVADYRYFHHGRSYALGISVGVVTLDEHTEGVREAFLAADSAARNAKLAGRNRVERYRPGLVENLHEEADVLVELVERVDDDRVELWARPLGSCEENCGDALEYSVRVRAGSGVLLEYSDYETAAERYDVLGALDRWLAEATLNHLGRMPRQAHDQALRALIPISGRSVIDPDFRAFLASAIADRDVPSGWLGIALEESFVAEELDRAGPFMEAVKRHGCRIYIDGFGEGRSVLSQVAHLEIDGIRLDRALIHGLEQQPRRQMVVSSLLALARSLGWQALAEGADSDATREFLCRRGIAYVSGNALGFPKPCEEEPVARQLPG